MRSECSISLTHCNCWPTLIDSLYFLYFSFLRCLVFLTLLCYSCLLVFAVNVRFFLFVSFSNAFSLSHFFSLMCSVSHWACKIIPAIKHPLKNCVRSGLALAVKRTHSSLFSAEQTQGPCSYLCWERVPGSHSWVKAAHQSLYIYHLVFHFNTVQGNWWALSLLTF